MLDTYIKSKNTRQKNFGQSIQKHHWEGGKENKNGDRKALRIKMQTQKAT